MAWPAVKPYKGVSPSPGAATKGAGLSKVPKPLQVPSGMPKFPVPANLNFPLPAAGRLLPRLLARGIPFIGTAITFYELYRYITAPMPVVYPGWRLNCENPNPKGTINRAPQASIACTNNGGSGSLAYWNSGTDGATNNNSVSFIYHGPYQKLSSTLYSWPRSVHRAYIRVDAAASIPKLVEGAWVRTTFVNSPAARVSPRRQPLSFKKPKSWPQAVAEPGTQPSAEPAPKPSPAKNPRPTSAPLPAFPWRVAFVPRTIPKQNGLPEPLQPPNIIIQPSPGGVAAKPPVTSSPGSPRNTPPGARQKERKLHARTVVGSLGMAVLGAPGEILDFLDVLWEAIPKDLRSVTYYKGKKKAPSYSQKMRDLYNHWETIDVASAFAGYVNNQVEDGLYGRLGKVQQKFNQVADTPTSGGALSGPKDGPEDAYKKSPIPQLTYDPETGKWGIKWLDYERTT